MRLLLAFNVAFPGFVLDELSRGICRWFFFSKGLGLALTVRADAASAGCHGISCLGDLPELARRALHKLEVASICAGGAASDNRGRRAGSLGLWCARSWGRWADGRIQANTDPVREARDARFPMLLKPERNCGAH